MAEDDLRPRPDPTLLTTEALHREIQRLGELFDTKLAGLAGLTDERFRAMDGVLQMVENRRVEQKTDTSNTVDRTLEAAKEAVAKAETTTNQAIEATRREMSDLKERVTTLEGQKTGSREGLGAVYAAAGFVLVLLSIAAVVVALLAGGS